MKNLLTIAWMIALLSCASQASDTTSSADSTATALPATNPFLALESGYDPRDEEEVNPGDSIEVVRAGDVANDVPNSTDSATYEGPADFQPGAAGDPPSPEEEEAQRKIDEAEPVETTSKPLNEFYYTSTRGNEYVTYSLRFDEGTITGFCFPFEDGSSPALIIVAGTIDEHKGTFTFRELASATVTKIFNIVEGEMKNGNLIGRRFTEDRSVSVPFEGKRVGPQPHALRYTFMHKVIDAVPKLFTITVASPATGYRQKLTLNWPVENSMRRMLTVDWNFDGHLDLFLICGDQYCGGHFFLYNPDIRKFKPVEAVKELPNPWVDYGNKRIISIVRQGDGSVRLTTFEEIFKKYKIQH